MLLFNTIFLNADCIPCDESLYQRFHPQPTGWTFTWEACIHPFIHPLIFSFFLLINSPRSIESEFIPDTLLSTGDMVKKLCRALILDIQSSGRDKLESAKTTWTCLISIFFNKVLWNNVLWFWSLEKIWNLK